MEEPKRAARQARRGRKWLAARRVLREQWEELAGEMRSSGLWPLVAEAADELYPSFPEVDDLAIAAYLEASLRLRCQRPAETLRDAFVSIATGTAGQRWAGLQSFANQQESFLREGLKKLGRSVDGTSGIGGYLAVAAAAGVIPLAERHREHLAQAQRQVEEEARKQEGDRRRYRQQRTDELQVRFIEDNEESEDASVCLYRATMVLRISRNEAAHAKLDQVLHGRLTLRLAFADLLALACLVALRLYLLGLAVPQPDARDIVATPSEARWRRLTPWAIAVASLVVVGALAFAFGGDAIRAARKAPVGEQSTARARIEQDRKQGECANSHARFLADRKAGLIRPFTLTYRRGMPFSADERAHGVHETRLLEMLTRHELRDVVVLGGAGIGKSTFARKVVFGQQCLKMPAFFVVVENLYGPNASPSSETNPILEAVAKSMNFETPEQRAGLWELLRQEDWLLILDGLDEASPEHRTKMTADVRDLAHRHRGSLHLVAFGRRPLEENPDYGLKIDNVLEIPPLTCAEAELDLKARMTEDERARFWEFLERNGLNKQETSPLVCHYTYIHNFRDMVVLTALFRGTDRVPSLVKAPRAEVVKTYVQMRLIEDAPEQRGQHLARVDELMSRFWPIEGPQSLSRTPVFNASFCHDRTAREMCILESDLFVPKGPEGDYVFKDRSLASFFKARALDKQLASKGQDCKTVGQYVATDAEVAEFLAATPQGERCAELLRSPEKAGAGR